MVAQVVSKNPKTVTSNPKIIVIIPAHNEELGMAATIEGLLSQDIPLHKIVVVVNTKKSYFEDKTSQIARSYINQGVLVEELILNVGMKSGALNFGWLRHGQDADYVFTMDADTIVFPDTLRLLLKEFKGHRKTGAVCARYWAQAGSGLAWRMQRIEYSRQDDSRDLRGWKVQVASGAAAMYRQDAILDVLQATGRKAPWDASSLIEDYALSLDMRSLHWLTTAAPGAHVLTDTPQTFKELWNQRIRWGRGGMDEVRKRGWQRYMWSDIIGYGVFGVGMVGRLLFLAYLCVILTSSLTYNVSWLGFIPLVVMFFSRFTSFMRLNGKGWIDYLLVVPILIEDLYGFFLEACATVSIFKSFRSTSKAW